MTSTTMSAHEKLHARWFAAVLRQAECVTAYSAALRKHQEAHRYLDETGRRLRDLIDRCGGLLAESRMDDLPAADLAATARDHVVARRRVERAAAAAARASAACTRAIAAAKRLRERVSAQCGAESGAAA